VKDSYNFENYLNEPIDKIFVRLNHNNSIQFNFYNEDAINFLAVIKCMKNDIELQIAAKNIVYNDNTLPESKILYPKNSEIICPVSYKDLTTSFTHYLVVFFLFIWIHSSALTFVCRVVNFRLPQVINFRLP